MNGFDYYNKLERALAITENSIARAEIKATDEYDAVNHTEILYSLYKVKNAIIRMQNAHKFYRLSKDAFILKAERKESKKIEILHEVKGYETLTLIAQKYGIEINQILEKNNITSNDLVAGMILRLEMPDSKKLLAVYENIPTYGSQEGILVLGTDVSNNLLVDADGELQILSCEDTLKQGLTNRMTTRKGDYPLADDFGIEIGSSGEIPNDLYESFYLIKITNQLKQDARISEIIDLSVTREQNSIKAIGTVKTINKQSLAI
jgi:LysM repeat protein